MPNIQHRAGAAQAQTLAFSQDYSGASFPGESAFARTSSIDVNGKT